MIGGAVLNAAAFTGGNHLTKYLAGDDGQAGLAKKTQHDKALEAYQAAMEKYTLGRTQLLDWIETNREIKDQAKQNFTNTVCAFKLYNQAHPDYKLSMPKEPKSQSSQTCINQVICKNKASFFLSAVEHSRLVTLLFVSFKLFLLYK